MQVVKVRARIGPFKKSLPISKGYRPTLLIDGRKALSNFEFIEPSSLPPREIGEAEIVIGWDWPMPCPLKVNDSFSILEGEREVGSGVLIRVISTETR